MQITEYFQTKGLICGIILVIVGIACLITFLVTRKRGGGYGNGKRSKRSKTDKRQ
jgi:hypothetical protein